MLPWPFSLAGFPRAVLVLVALFGSLCCASGELSKAARTDLSAQAPHCNERGFKPQSTCGQFACHRQRNAEPATTIHSTDTQVALNSLEASGEVAFTLHSTAVNLQATCKQLQSTDRTVHENGCFLRKGGVSASSLSQEKI